MRPLERVRGPAIVSGTPRHDVLDTCVNSVVAATSALVRPLCAPLRLVVPAGLPLPARGRVYVGHDTPRSLPSPGTALVAGG